MGFRSDLSFCFLLVFFVMGVLVCKGVLKVMCLAWLVLVMASTTVCELASFGTLIQLCQGGLMRGMRVGCKVLCSLQRCKR